MVFTIYHTTHLNLFIFILLELLFIGFFIDPPALLSVNGAIRGGVVVHEECLECRNASMECQNVHCFYGGLRGIVTIITNYY